MKTKVVVTGSEGMLGKALMKSFSNAGMNVIGTDIRAEENKADITIASDIRVLLNKIKPEIVIHTAGYTDVDGCESDTKKAYLINSDGTKNAAEACKATGASLIYISTDFVFDGDKESPYTEDDKPNPLSVYGKSKLKGEEYIAEILDNYLIIRTSWLFGAGGKNFVDTIIAKAQKGEELKVVDDQRGSPTYTEDLAGVIANLILRTLNPEPRTLHITNSGSCSWYEFAKEILKAKGLNSVKLKAIASEETDRPAKRPKMSVLDNSKFNSVSGKVLPSWQDALRRYLLTIA